MQLDQDLMSLVFTLQSLSYVVFRESVVFVKLRKGLGVNPSYFSCTVDCAFSVTLLVYLQGAFSSFPYPVFKPEELRQALMPTLESLYRQDPESLPFRQPVDPMLLGIPVRSTHALAMSYFHLKQKLILGVNT